MKRVKRRSRRTEAEIRKLVADYENGRQSRADYCARHGLPVTTLDYYRRKVRLDTPVLLEVDLREVQETAWGHGVSVVLGNQRRVEIAWSELAQVPEHSQSLGSFLRWLEEA